MPQSLSYILIHLVFSTKHRVPYLGKAIRPALHAYLATIARNTGCECYCVAGVADHVHLAIRLSRMIAVAGLVERLKKLSSKWLKTRSPELQTFAWQRGYSIFSVRPSGLETLRHYIQTQEQHHTAQSFQTEYRGMLREGGVGYDEQPVWE